MAPGSIDACPIKVKTIFKNAYTLFADITSSDNPLNRFVELTLKPSPVSYNTTNMPPPGVEPQKLPRKAKCTNNSCANQEN